ncbi:MAG: class I SAM-dependent methyltransferase [Bradyrhizobium sp.]|uniref:class I SAM-dependent methyltransferase n=1 Tax=Bradyrhizobium sp. TaxID=376 RepID=UPI003D0D9E7E
MLLTKCLACGSRDLHPILDLGRQALANDFHPFDRASRVYPLAVTRCARCTHAQLAETVAPEMLFSDYAYQTGVSVGPDHYRMLLHQLAVRHGASASVLEVGCNDGTLLGALHKAGFDVLGVDPAANLCRDVAGRGLPVHCGFWNVATAAEVNRTFDAIVAFNVLAHTADPRAFLSACRTALKPGGAIYVQTSQVHWLARGEFDCVYHEHVSYFTPQSMAALARAAGLVMTRYVEVPDHGGSYRYVLEATGETAMCPPAATGRWIQREADETAWAFRHLVQRARADGPVAGYGACAKGMVALQYAETDLDYIVDETPTKIGRYAPGSLTQIVEPAWLVGAAGPLTVVILAWNHYDAIARKVQSIRKGRPTRLLRYLPRCQTLGEFDVPTEPTWRTAA